MRSIAAGALLRYDTDFLSGEITAGLEACARSVASVFLLKSSRRFKPGMVSSLNPRAERGDNGDRTVDPSRSPPVICTRRGLVSRGSLCSGENGELGLFLVPSLVDDLLN